MAYVLKLEAIGNDVTCGPADKMLLRLLGANMPRRWWVAEITGTDQQYGLARTFVKGRADYTHSNSKGTRGVYEYYILFPGKLYEIKSPESWKRIDRYFARVEGSELIRMTREEALEWVNAHSALTS